jgi:hypothetical protein
MGQDSLDQPIVYDRSGKIMGQFDLLKKDLYNLSNMQNENVRLARWNTYYYKKYKAQNRILVYIILVCITIFTLTLLHKTFSFFDRSSYLIIVGTIIAIAIMYVTLSIYYIYIRDNMNFDEIDYGKNNIIRMQAIPETKNYVDISANTCKENDPRNLANSNFLKQLFLI